MTDEGGQSEVLEAYLTSLPLVPTSYQIRSTLPSEATVDPQSLVFSVDNCQPKSISIVGQDDGIIDGDRPYEVEFLDQDLNVVLSIPGVNLDNDLIQNLTVDISGPRSLMIGESGSYLVRVSNTGAVDFINHDLLLDSTLGLDLTGFACTMLSGLVCDYTSTLLSNSLILSGVDIAVGDTLLLSIDVRPTEVVRTAATVSLHAQLVEPTTGDLTQDTETTPIAILRASFEDPSP